MKNVNHKKIDHLLFGLRKISEDISFIFVYLKLITEI